MIFDKTKRITRQDGELNDSQLLLLVISVIDKDVTIKVKKGENIDCLTDENA